MSQAEMVINHLEGATYAGWLGAGALGQQEAAKTAVAMATKTSFMGSVDLCE